MLKTEHDFPELPVDNSWLDPYYDPLIFDTQIESMELKTQQEAAEMHVDDALNDPSVADIETMAHKRKADALESKRYRAKVRMDPRDPMALVDIVQIKRERRKKGGKKEGPGCLCRV